MLKRLLRSRPTQVVLSAIVAFYMWLIVTTVRWRVVNGEVAERIRREGGGVCVLCWHGRLLMFPACWPLKEKKRAALISTSRDGQFIAEACEAIGLKPIRGSSRRAGKGQKSKGGENAYREMIGYAKDGWTIGVLPDGPRGPRMRAAPGAARLARQAQIPVLCVGMSAKWRIVVNSWDRQVLPLPFSPGAMVWRGPIDPPPLGGGAGALEAARAHLEAELIAATQEADRMLGVEVIEPAPPAEPE